MAALARLQRSLFRRKKRNSSCDASLRGLLLLLWLRLWRRRLRHWYAGPARIWHWRLTSLLLLLLHHLSDSRQVALRDRRSLRRGSALPRRLLGSRSGCRTRGLGEQADTQGQANQDCGDCFHYSLLVSSHGS